MDTSLPDCDLPFEVTTNIDINDGFCNSHCTLREAIIAANEVCPGQQNTIQLDYSTYALQIRGPGDDRGDLNITDDLVIIGLTRGTVGDSTIIGNESRWIYRIFEIAEEVNVEMQDLVILGGDVTDGDGGGILNHGSLTLDRVSLQKNEADRGGGLYNNGLAILRDVQVIDNRAAIEFPAHDHWNRNTGYFSVNYPDDPTTTDCGGGITNAGTMEIYYSTISRNLAALGAGICNTAGGSLKIESSEISGNGAIRSTIAGGGIATLAAATISENSIVSGNTAAAGAGIFANIPDGQELVLKTVSVTENQTDNNYGNREIIKGAGLYIHGGQYKITQSVIDHNSTIGDGGGLYLSTESSGTIARSSLVYNRAGGTSPLSNGGGLYVGYGSRSELTNVTISNNDASGAGGGIWASGSTTLRNVTIAQNYHNVFADRAIFLQNSIITQSRSLPECEFGRDGEIQSWGYNISGDDSCGLDAVGDLSDVTNEDLELGLTLTSFGLSAQLVHLLGETSIAVDRIPAEECPPPTRDQLGAERRYGDGCDVGSIEWIGRIVSTSGTAPTQPSISPAASQPSEIGTDSLCWKGPGPAYEVVDNLTQGTEVEILGTGDLQGWLVINNPRYLIPCWVPEGFVVVDPQLDRGEWILFAVPNIPTITPVPAEPQNPPTAPGQLAATTTICSANDYAVSLQWIDLANNETGFLIYRDGELIATLGANANSYTDHPPYSGPHSYSVQAYNNAGSAQSETEQDTGCIF